MHFWMDKGVCWVKNGPVGPFSIDPVDDLAVTLDGKTPDPPMVEANDEEGWVVLARGEKIGAFTWAFVSDPTSPHGFSTEIRHGKVEMRLSERHQNACKAYARDILGIPA